jgi:hypothetical protein
VADHLIQGATLMRIYLLLGWLVLPVAGVAYHYGPGQERMRLDDVASLLSEAQTAVDSHDWSAAQERLDEALKLIPAGHTDAVRRVRIERAKAQMMVKQLPDAQRELLALVDEIKGDPKADPTLQRDAREALANAQFYMTWLMRLEGQPRETWEPEIEASRQNYRLLAEQAEAGKDASCAQRAKEDLESAIRLARLDIKDLQGLPLPSQ